MSQSLIALFLTVLTAFAVQAKTYNFKELSLKDYTEMEQLVRKAVGRNTIDDVEREPKVREGLRLVFSRTNTDGKRSALVTSLQGQLPEPFYMLSIQKIAEQAIADLKDMSKSPLERSTAYIILENIISEMSPRSQDYRVTYQTIADANIKIDEELGTFRRLSGMANNVSPSKTAEAQLKKTAKTASLAASPDLED